MPGPPVVPFYLRRHLAPKVARASMLLIFFGTAIAGTLAALWVGIATGRLFLLSLLLFPPMWLGNRAGARHFGRVQTGTESCRERVGPDGKLPGCDGPLKHTKTKHNNYT